MASGSTGRVADYELGDLVWVKNDRWPWWPAIVCGSDRTDDFVRNDKIHIYFFDEPITRNWISRRDIHHFTSSSECYAGGPYYGGSKNVTRLRMAIHADRMSSLSNDDRVQRLLDCIQSAPTSKQPIRTGGKGSEGGGFFNMDAGNDDDKEDGRSDVTEECDYSTEMPTDGEEISAPQDICDDADDAACSPTHLHGSCEDVAADGGDLMERKRKGGPGPERPKIHKKKKSSESAAVNDHGYSVKSSEISAVPNKDDPKQVDLRGVVKTKVTSLALQKQGWLRKRSPAQNPSVLECAHNNGQRGGMKTRGKSLEFDARKQAASQPSVAEKIQKSADVVVQKAKPKYKPQNHKNHKKISVPGGAGCSDEASTSTAAVATGKPSRRGRPPINRTASQTAAQQSGRVTGNLKSHRLTNNSLSVAYEEDPDISFASTSRLPTGNGPRQKTNGLHGNTSEYSAGNCYGMPADDGNGGNGSMQFGNAGFGFCSQQNEQNQLRGLLLDPRCGDQQPKPFGDNFASPWLGHQAPYGVQPSPNSMPSARPVRAQNGSQQQPVCSPGGVQRPVAYSMMSGPGANLPVTLPQYDQSASAVVPYQYQYSETGPLVNCFRLIMSEMHGTYQHIISSMHTHAQEMRAYAQEMCQHVKWLEQQRQQDAAYGRNLVSTIATMHANTMHVLFPPGSSRNLPGPQVTSTSTGYTVNGMSPGSVDGLAPGSLDGVNFHGPFDPNDPSMQQ